MAAGQAARQTLQPEGLTARTEGACAVRSLCAQAWDDLLVDQDDPEKRIGDLEHRLSEQKHDADMRSAALPEMGFPAQTPGNQRRMHSKDGQRAAIGMALVIVFVVGAMVTTYSLDREDGAVPSVVWLGVAMIVLSVLIPVALVIRLIVREFKESPLRQLGTVQLLTVASSRHYGSGVGSYVPHYRSDGYYWELTSEMQIRLDNGHTFRGSYFADVQEWQMRRTRRYFTPDGVAKIRPRPEGYLPHFDEWFRVGASWRCLYNPANPDEVLVAPFEGRGDRVEYEDSVSFYSAT